MFSIAVGKGIINRHGNGEERPHFRLYLFSPFYYLGNRCLRSQQASIPPFTGVHGLRLHEETCQHEDLF